MVWRNLTLLAPLVVSLGCGVAARPVAQDNQDEAAPMTADTVTAGQPAASDAQQPTVVSTKKPVFLPEDGPSVEDHPDLHNLLQVTGQIYSGAEPKTEAAFRQLAELGVQAIVSVDGARPNLEMAKKYGMRYVHIPIGYDGLDPEAVKAFAQAANQLDEITYVHCHHGRHRGPAGAAAICVATGQVDGEQALKILEKAGTSKKYPGLWRDVQGYQRPGPNETLPELVSVARIESIPAAMAKLDRASDNLKLSQEAQWSVPQDHPDLVPAEEAKQMVQGLEDTLTNLSGDYDNPELKTWLAGSIEAAKEFEMAIRLGQLDAATAHFERVQQSCDTCHQKYRNQ